MNVIQPQLSDRQRQTAREYYCEASQPIIREMAELRAYQPRRFTVSPEGAVGDEEILWLPGCKEYNDKLSETLEQICELAISTALRDGIP